MDNVSKEIKEYGTINTFLPEAGALERATTYRDKKIKPLFIQMKNKIAAMAAQVKELTSERDTWKNKFQKKKQECEETKEELQAVQQDKKELSKEKDILQNLAGRYHRIVRVLGNDMVEDIVQRDIQNQKILEEKRRMEQMPQGSIKKRMAWAEEKRRMENQQRKKNRTKNRGMEL